MKRNHLTLASLLTVTTCLSSQAGIILNEVHLNPPNGTDLGDRNFEYIELRSTLATVDKTETTNGLTILIINNDRWDYKTNDLGVEVPTVLNLGEVTEAWSLEDMHTGTNGLLLLGDKYPEIPKGGPWAGFIDPATEVGDPPGMGEGNIKSNDGLTIYLISGYTNPTPNSGPVGNQVVDFDVDNNGVFDWLQADPKPAGAITVQPWTATLDSVGMRDRNNSAWPTAPAPSGVTGIMEPYVASSANINVYALSTPPTWSIGDRDPESFSRNAGVNTASLASAWYGGKFVDPLSGTDPATTTAYRPDRVFGLANGIATPGRVNLSTAPPVADFRINEVNLDPSSDRFQYIEIVNTNTPSGSRSLSGYWLVLVDSNVSTNDATAANKVGTILEEWDLSAMATGTNGLLVIADDASSNFNVFEDFMPAATGKGEPVSSNTNPKATGFAAGDIGSKSGFTLMLIKNYKTATADASLAPGRDIDSNDDGLADAGAFGTTGSFTIADSVGFDMAAPLPSGAGKTYATVNLRTVFPEFTANDGNKACDNFSRKTNVSGVPVGTNTAASWYGGEFASSAGFNLGFQPPQADQATVNNPTGTTHFGGFRGAATPGRPNLSASINAASPPVAADIRINEVMFDATDTQVDSDPNNTDLDLNRDYIELISTNRALAYLEGYWIVVIDNAGSNKGVVFKGAPLDGQTTGLNGVLLIGDNYDNPISIPYVNIEGLIPPATATVDPVVAFGGDDIPGKGATILLIRGSAFDLTATPNGPFKVGGPVTIGTNLKPSGDLDPDNDGVLLAPADWLAPGAVIVDAISIGPIDPGPGYGWVSSAWLPDCAARYPGDSRAATPDAWYFGQIDQTANPIVASTAFTSNFSGSFRGNASPGRWNHSASVGPVTAGSVLINECHFNPAGGDGNFEFIELIDRALGSRSLNGYSLVMVDNVKNNTGTVQRAWSLDGFHTGSNGLFVTTNGTAATSPFAPVLRTQSQVGDPPGRDDLISGFGDATIATESDNQSVMLLLVRGFNSAVGIDLDEKAGIVDTPGDGIFDNAGAAWEGGIVHDSIVLRSWIPPVVGPPAVAGQWNGYTYGLADLSGTFFPDPNTRFYHPETVARFRGNFDTNSAAAWYAGDLVGGLSGKLGTDTTYQTNVATNPPMPLGFLGRTTPGQPNISSSENGDPDGDGLATLLEEAFGTDPHTPTVDSPLPTIGQVDVGGTLYGAISYRRIKGGTTAASKTYAAEAFTYTVQTSTDLTNWVTDGSPIELVGTATANPDGITETVTFRLLAPVSSTIGRAYMRLKIGRQ